MKQSRLALCLKICTIIIAVVAATLLYHILPTGVDVCLEELLSYAWLALPSKVIIYLSSIPCAIALIAFFLICTEIGHDNSFSRINVKRLILISVCAMCGVVLCAAEFLLLFSAGALHPAIMLLCIAISLFGVTVSAAAAILSHLVEKACALREEHDLTV